MIRRATSTAQAVLIAAVASLTGLSGLSAKAEVAAAVLGDMDACLVESATGRDVLNTTVTCFNTARTACGADVLECEIDLETALRERAEDLRNRMPEDLEGVPDFAKERYREILADIDGGARSLCADVPRAERISCGYRAQALRLAKLRSLGAQVDPRFLIP